MHPWNGAEVVLFTMAKLELTKKKISNVKKSTWRGHVFPIAKETSNVKNFSISFHIYKRTFFVISNFTRIEEMVFVSQPSLFTFFNVIYEVNLSRDGFLYYKYTLESSAVGVKTFSKI